MDNSNLKASTLSGVGQSSVYSNFGDYCTCQRCPCCGKLINNKYPYQNPFPGQVLCKTPEHQIVKSDII